MASVSLPDMHGIFVLILMVCALILFTRERIALETSSLAILTILLVGFEVYPYYVEGERLHAIEFFKGFGHEALIAVCALMIVGQGLVRTGALEPMGRFLAKAWNVSPSLSLLLTLLISAVFSAFVNNVPIVVLLLPILISIGHRTGKSPSGMLMPMGFATLIGGMSTTIGTSTNLLVVSVANDVGNIHFGMFDFVVPAVIAGGVAILFLWLVAPHILPKRETPLGDFSPRIFEAHLHVEEGGFAEGKTFSDVREKSGNKLQVLEILRDDDKIVRPLPDATLRAGDRLAVRDTPENLKDFEEALGMSLYRDDDSPIDEDNPLRAEGQQIAEVVVTQGSSLQGAVLSDIRFADRYQLVILALHRPGHKTQVLQKDIGNMILRTGDVLLVQGTQEKLAELKKSGHVLVLDATSDLPRTSRAPIATVIMLGVVAAAAFGLMPIAISAVCGILLMLISRCMTWRDAAQALNTRVILIVVASLALGSALLQTGGADFMARLFLAVSAGSSPPFILAGLMLVMAILTNIVSNNAAAVIGTPIAINIAHQLGLPAEPFILAVLFGANLSFVTPMAYKTNLLVMSAGGYEFSDFVRVGLPLAVLLWAVFSFLLPQMYGF
ncbi:membrane protein [Terasakiella brassicae]|uniref:Membrane protein n=1 Tax=Terasakiella brassicae TaxID=1634917 RepID=A0A917C6X7_9PROT|nr:SLC13 family permease [Terasakiella brassicae]GGF71859.1 membrane protein [Terasakiella brassicae]